MNGFCTKPLIPAAHVLGELVLVIAAHEHDRQVRADLAQPGQDLGAAHLRHRHVEEDRVDRVRSPRSSRSMASGPPAATSTVSPNDFEEAARDVRTIGSSSTTRTRPLPRQLLGRRRAVGTGDEALRGSTIRNVVPWPTSLYTRSAPAWPRTMPEDGREAKAAAGELRGEERVEDAGLRLGVHPDARCRRPRGRRSGPARGRRPDGRPTGSRRSPAGPSTRIDDGPAPLADRVGRVDDEVHDAPGAAGRRRPRRRPARRQVELEDDALADRHLQQRRAARGRARTDRPARRRSRLRPE